MQRCQKGSKRRRNKWSLRPVSSQSRSQLLSSPTKRSTTMPRLASVYTKRTIAMTYIRNSFCRYYHYTREKKRNQFLRRRQKVFFAAIWKTRFIKCKLNTQPNTCCNFLSQPNGSGINKIAGLNEIMQTDGQCTQMYRAIIVSFHDCPINRITIFSR